MQIPLPLPPSSIGDVLGGGAIAILLLREVLTFLNKRKLNGTTPESAAIRAEMRAFAANQVRILDGIMSNQREIITASNQQTQLMTRVVTMMEERQR